MNILWLTNIPLPEASELMNEKSNFSGGWLTRTAKDLSEQDNLELTVIFPKNGITELKSVMGKQIKYYLFPPVKKNHLNSVENNIFLKQILKEVKPDIVHIFGTEYSHSLAMVNVCKNKSIKTIISIQGLVSIIAKHYMACLPPKIQRRFTFRDFIKHDNLIMQQKKFSKRGRLEIEALKKTDNVIGRTTWDKACTSQINSNVNYHFCNETLREEFYNHTWDIDKCENYSIFMSQGSYPIKGLHFLLESMPLILKRFPDAKLYISGPDITKSDTLKERIKRTSYAKYIKELIKKYDLKEKVIFTGLLDEKEMCQRYLKSNVFVCPSTIENSPNSLGEAMILGVPCVASNVGGIPDMMKHKEQGFIYQTDAPYMLAYYVCEIFDNDKLALEFSKNARVLALKTHDVLCNLLNMKCIYREVF